jgi:hypothetical protein
VALVLKSGVTGNCYAPFGSGSEGGDSLTDHNLGGLELGHENIVHRIKELT